MTVSAAVIECEVVKRGAKADMVHATDDTFVRDRRASYQRSNTYDRDAAVLELSRWSLRVRCRVS